MSILFETWYIFYYYYPVCYITRLVAMVVGCIHWKQPIFFLSVWGNTHEESLLNHRYPTILFMMNRWTCQRVTSLQVYPPSRSYLWWIEELARGSPHYKPSSHQDLTMMNRHTCQRVTSLQVCPPSSPQHGTLHESMIMRNILVH